MFKGQKVFSQLRSLSFPDIQIRFQRIENDIVIQILQIEILCISFVAYSKVSGGDKSPLFHYSYL
ncbi:hypothetical protein AO498_01665 [Algoriphagus sanaruensis]|uniref:Uncharacterized protein n=1 Tax=Algoriphagus sanaruensis TaxID=1727163 RepID=A0A142EIX6_9BACT|nr:hypothetical protein AO498_01665 [Algoriphagus sanaruensis]